MKTGGCFCEFMLKVKHVIDIKGTIMQIGKSSHKLVFI